MICKNRAEKDMILMKIEDDNMSLIRHAQDESRGSTEPLPSIHNVKVRREEKTCSE
jgi:hypothetical protein